LWLGYVSYSLNKAGYKVTGLDVSENAVASAKKMYGDFFICEDFFKHKPKQLYDVICMLELIEHVDDPGAYIAHVRTILKPNGRLILTTPNRSWFSKADVWNTDLPPVHLTWFSEQGVQEFLSSNGFVPKLFDYKWYNFCYGSLLKPAPVRGVRQPVFSENGELLTVPYEKSNIRKVTEKLHIYILLKKTEGMIKKIFEIFKIVINPTRISLRKSNTICISARLQ
jgi:SAM-dependent methyltransferase